MLYLEKITDWLDRCFPEFKPFFGERLKSATAMFVLSEYGSPSKVANMNQASFERLRRVSRGRFSSARFAELKALARSTVGTCYEVDEWCYTSKIFTRGKSVYFQRTPEKKAFFENKLTAFGLLIRRSLRHNPRKR